MSKNKSDATALTKQVSDSPGGLRVEACKLVQKTGVEEGREVELGAYAIQVGSSTECQVRVDEETLSRKHFEIDQDGDHWVIRDLGSTNGTFLDGTRIKEAILHPGSTIRAGDAQFRFEPILSQSDIEPSESTEFGHIYGQSYQMRCMFTVLEKVADSNVTILIRGETGTGKTALARAIHDASGRATGPFRVVDCGAIAPTLVESELFGHERGSFTGAVKDRQGAFELANGGTLFIDELTELDMHLQPKLLRALEEREITRVGSHNAIPINCRVIAATQYDLWEKVEKEEFRADLFFRLAVVTIPLPPLRERRDDLPLLVDHFLADLESEHQHFADLNPEMQRKLLAHHWPGNIRELRNTMQRVSLMYSDDPFSSVAAPGVAKGGPVSTGGGSAVTFTTDLTLPFKESKARLLSDFEREYVLRLLDRAGGSVTKAAESAGLDRKHIYNLMSKHQIGDKS